jgi:glycosyltransferase involved in cell wall biosynthesis
MTVDLSAPTTTPVPASRSGGVLRIGFATTSLPEPDRKPGGVDVHVDRLADRLAGRGHRVTVFTYSPPVPDRRYDVHQLAPASTTVSKGRRLVVAPLRLNRLDTAALDVLHLHGDDWFYVRRRLPTVRTFYGSALYEARHATRSRRRASQYAIYLMEVMASRLATTSYGIIPGDGPGYRTAGHLPLAIDLPTDARVERQGPPTVLFVGTWNGRKRGRLLHEAFQRDVLPRVADARLVMVSDHCEPGPNVRWLRRPSDAELAELYRGAAVFCLPSAYEGFGLPYLEAMGHATPVIATANPGARLVLDGGRAGVLAEPDRLGDELVRLLRDERARVALAGEGRRRAEQFAWEPVLERHERAYRDAIARFGTATTPR